LKRSPSKSNLHPRNKHRGGYDFDKLVASFPGLSSFVIKNDFNNSTIDFSNSKAVKALNKAILKSDYGVRYWDIPVGYLCPPVPGRVDYIHYVADLLAETNSGKIPFGKQIQVLDIGIGANCIYPLVGNAEYGWQFTGTDIDEASLKNAEGIIEQNDLKEDIELRLQKSSLNIFSGVLKDDDLFDVTICNPPFHNSVEEAIAGTDRKWKNLKVMKEASGILNFGGKSNELVYKGGERSFLYHMIKESKNYSKNCFWFTSLVSKSSNLESIYRQLENEKVYQVKTIEMKQGQKTSRFVAWTYLDLDDQQEWINQRWK
jgi:23S rRNA (adenine1618-N6)-methyltransferase